MWEATDTGILRLISTTSPSSTTASSSLSDVLSTTVITNATASAPATKDHNLSAVLEIGVGAGVGFLLLIIGALIALISSRARNKEQHPTSEIEEKLVPSGSVES